MAKELPYFRFTASEWLNDDISLESYELKGIFSDVCAFYWFKDCSIDLALLNKRFSNARILIEQLIELGIIKVESTELFISIKFLDEQYDLLSEKRKKRSEAGRIGGLKKSSNARLLLKQKSSYKDKDKDKENYKDNINIEFDIFWNLYDKKIGDKNKCIRNWLKLTNLDRQKIIDILPEWKKQFSEKQYQPYPTTFLNQKRWNDEIIKNGTHNQNNTEEKGNGHTFEVFDNTNIQTK